MDKSLKTRGEIRTKGALALVPRPTEEWVALLHSRHPESVRNFFLRNPMPITMFRCTDSKSRNREMSLYMDENLCFLIAEASTRNGRLGLLPLWVLEALIINAGAGFDPTAL